MSEKNNIFENDLLMRAILEGGQEEVPGHIWNAVSERLDEVAGTKTGRTVTLWWRRAGIAVATAAAAVASVLMIERTETTDVVPADITGDLIAVVKPEAAETPQTSGAKLLAYTPTVVTTPIIEEETVVAAPMKVEEKAVIVEKPIVEEKPVIVEKTVVEERHEAVSDWKEDLPDRKIRTSIVISGITGSSNSQTNTNSGVLKAPALIMKPTKTGIEEKESQTKYSIPVAVGAGVRIELSPRWSIGAGLNYTNLTRTFKGTYTHVDEDGKIDNTITSDIKNSQHYIGLPVNAYFNIISSKHVNFYASAGGTVEKCVYDKYLILTDNITHKESVKGVQLSAGLGIGAEFMLGQHLGLYIDPSLRYYFDCDQPKSIRTAQPLMFGVEAGFRFKL